MDYLFDGSLEGLLTAVFEYFERKPAHVRLVVSGTWQPDAFTQHLIVYNDREKADRVWKALCKKLDPTWQRRFYCCLLTEVPDALQQLFDFSVYLFKNDAGVEENYGHPAVLAVSKYAHNAEREKHRMEAFIRFKRTADGLFYCAVEPDFNVLPLISKHFRERYTDQQWLIYDLRRKYGILYDLKTVSEIELDMPKSLATQSEVHDTGEQLYEALWKDYFNSTNIKARKNTKLHIRHVPKRYWRYLTEKL